MSNNNWSRWYREGTVKCVNGSKVVTGTDTYWLTAGLHAGDIFSLDGVTDYEIDAVSSNTQLTLTTAFNGTSVEGAGYSIVRNFTATMPAEIAAKTAGLIGDFIKYIDTDMQSIHGKSAYEIAKANGYVGTESEWLVSLKGASAYDVARDGGYTGTQAEWLESLKAAGEWSTLDERTTPLTWNSVALHNTIWRGKNLGTEFTDEQKAAIAAGTFEDLYLGDTWTIGSYVWEIMGFDYHWSQWTGSGETIDGVNMLPWQNKHHVVVRLKWKTDNHGAALGDHRDPPTHRYWIEAPWQECTSYKDSNYFVNLRPAVIEQLEAFFGSDHLYHWKDLNYICDANGKYTGGSWFHGICEIETAWNVWGKCWRQMGEATESYLEERMCQGNGQFPAMRVNPQTLIMYNSMGALRDMLGTGGQNLMVSVKHELGWFRGGYIHPYACIM